VVCEWVEGCEKMRGLGLVYEELLRWGGDSQLHVVSARVDAKHRLAGSRVVRCDVEESEVRKSWVDGKVK
jgi:hypothetical protein